MTSPLDGQTPSLLRLAASNAEPGKSPFPQVKPCLEPVNAAALLDNLVCVNLKWRRQRHCGLLAL